MSTTEASEAARALGRVRSARKAASSKKNLEKARLAMARKILGQQPVVFACPENQPQKNAPILLVPKN